MLRKPRVGRKLLVASMGVATMTYVGTTSGCGDPVANLMSPGTSGSSSGGDFGTRPTGGSSSGVFSGPTPAGGSSSGVFSGSMRDAHADHAGDRPVIVMPTDASNMDSTVDSATDATSGDAAATDATSADSPEDSPTDASVTF